jgi:hypothetical protein
MAFIAASTTLDYVNAERRRHPAIFREAPSSPQSGPKRLDLIFLTQLQQISKASVFTRLEQRYSMLRDQLASMRLVTRGWDSYDAPPPGESSVRAAEQALNALRALNAEPDAVLPSADGGVGICFIHGPRYAHVEILNSGEWHALMYGGTNDPPEMWRIASVNPDALRETWSRISAYLQY